MLEGHRKNDNEPTEYLKEANRKLLLQNQKLCELLFQLGCAIKIQLSLLAYNKSNTNIISSNVTYFDHDIAEKLLIWR
jgi:hypothetical protein